MNISGLLENLKNNIDSMSMSEIILGGLSTALLAMMVVFTILVIISLIIKIINTQHIEKTNEVKKSDAYSNNKTTDIVDALASKAEEDISENLENNDELIAIITASIVAASGKNIVVKRITRTNNNKSNWEKISNI